MKGEIMPDNSEEIKIRRIQEDLEKAMTHRREKPETNQPTQRTTSQSQNQQNNNQDTNSSSSNEE
jgi:hypothetical protein